MVMNIVGKRVIPFLACMTAACSADQTTDPADAGASPRTDAAAPSPDSGATALDAAAPQADASTPVADGGSNMMTGCGRTSSEADGMQTVDVNGRQRSYVVTLPSGYDSSQPHKLIFVWHGLGGSAQQSAVTWRYHGIGVHADSTAILVAGQGIEDGQGRIGWGDASDMPFVEAMIDQLSRQYCVDPDRIFSSGHSYGGYMSNRVGCRLGHRFRAITPVMGGGPQIGSQTPTCQGKIAVWITHGRNDNVVPFSQGEGSRDYWRAANGCDETSSPTGVGECVAYDNCDDGHPVVWCPSDAEHRPPSYAPRAMWDFFAQF